uniref:Uncharacterized protein n=1 Tax=Avena sativa TaxID=4498 RepID=A0ACD5UBK9_AVESA
MSIRYVCFNIHVTSSPVHNGYGKLKAISKKKHVMYSDQVSMQQSVPARKYIGVLCMLSDAPMQAFPNPPTIDLDRHIEISEGIRGLESQYFCLIDIMTSYAESLHVHDVSDSHSMPEGEWIALKQCRMERCPKFDTVFPDWSTGFATLESLWAFDLPMARHIWSKPDHVIISVLNLQHLHLSSCPRLLFVLPVWASSCPRLETLHIVHCGDIKYIFVLGGRYPEKIATNGVAFPKLTTIHLYDLPTLRQVCEVKTVAPQLESIKIRGCFGLRRLPAVEARGPGVKKPTVEIEKDVWDALEWDGVEARHHPCHFEAPVHSRYYKKKLPRTSVLR